MDFFGGEEGEGAEGPQQGSKGPRGLKGPQPSAGARRRAAVGRPNLLVYIIRDTISVKTIKEALEQLSFHKEK